MKTSLDLAPSRPRRLSRSASARIPRSHPYFDQDHTEIFANINKPLPPILLNNVFEEEPLDINGLLEKSAVVEKEIQPPHVESSTLETPQVGETSPVTPQGAIDHVHLSRFVKTFSSLPRPLGHGRNKLRERRLGTIFKTSSKMSISTDLTPTAEEEEYLWSAKEEEEDMCKSPSAESQADYSTLVDNKSEGDSALDSPFVSATPSTSSTLAPSEISKSSVGKPKKSRKKFWSTWSKKFSESMKRSTNPLEGESPVSPTDSIEQSLVKEDNISGPKKGNDNWLKRNLTTFKAGKKGQAEKEKDTSPPVDGEEKLEVISSDFFEPPTQENLVPPVEEKIDENDQEADAGEKEVEVESSFLKRQSDELDIS
jgi:hypothetical protein